MWYFIWFLSTFLATSLAIIIGLWYERKEDALERTREREKVRHKK